jgi:uncharacterized protein YndB with AHSA1/START domain
MAKDKNHADDKLDLVLTRTIDVPRELVWKVWTDPQHVKKWFAPAPWKTVDCEIDLRPGGIFRTVMRSPEGQDYPNIGCYLELVEGERIVWTDALAPGYRPSLKPFFTVIITMEDHAAGTKYSAHAMHKDEADRSKHEKMGFNEGWGLCLDQLLEVAKKL